VAWPLRRFIVGTILINRPKESGHAYEKIWTKDGSPLVVTSKHVAAALQKRVSVPVELAMRYQNPSIEFAVKNLAAKGVNDALLIPLFPHYAMSSYESAVVRVQEVAAKFAPQMKVNVQPPYYDAPVYIEALASSIDDELRRLPFKPELILASFHGIPKSYVDEGDPYPLHCMETVRLLRERMQLGEDKLMLTFQSRFGRAEWLQPYTDKTVEALAQRGVKNLAVVTPGFSADCLETLEEIAVENGDIFKANGGENFAAIPCLNDSEAGMAVISHLVRRELQGWI